MAWQRKEVVRRDVYYSAEYKDQHITVTKGRILIDGNLQLEYKENILKVRQAVHCFEKGRYERSSYRLDFAEKNFAELSGYRLELEGGLVKLLKEIKSKRIKLSIKDALRGKPVQSDLYEKYGALVAQPFRI